MRNFIRLFVFINLFFLLSGFNALAASSPIYRLYSETTKEHLYTPDENEYYTLRENGWNDEGIGWISPEGGTPVYRLNNNGLKSHLYTTNENEVNVLTSQHGWTRDFDGKPLFYSGGDVAVYRLYNDALNGMHLLTTDFNEYETLSYQNWEKEGVALYGISTSSNDSSNNNTESKPNINRDLPYNDSTNVDKLMESNPKSYYNKLDENEKKFYKEVLEAQRNMKDRVQITDIEPNALSISRVLEAVDKEHPELFYIRSGSRSFTSTYVYFNYLIEDKNEIIQKQKELDEWAGKILNSIDSNQTDYDLALDIHDYIVLNTSYDMEGINDLENQSIISVVEKGKSVCAGYAKAFEYLTCRAGIYATAVDGIASGLFVGEHLWNMVQLDGDYSFVDVTFDDPSDIWLGREYFAVSKEEMSKDHLLFNKFFDYDDF